MRTPRAAATRFALHGTAGWSTMPGGGTTAVQAYGQAIGQLAGMVLAGDTEHPCDVRFGAEVVAVLETAERALADGGKIAVDG